jgi:hypothetical protein
LPQRRGDHPGRDDRVGVDEKQALAPRGPAAGVSAGGDLPAVDAHHGRVVLAGDLGRGVGRSVVDDDDLVGPPGRAGRRVDRPHRAAAARLLVVGRNDEREHCRGHGAADTEVKLSPAVRRLIPRQRALAAVSLVSASIW